jgi:nitrogen fixation NifU-like protein
VNVEDLYQEIILDHYRAKHHSGLRDPYEAEVHHVNPSEGLDLHEEFRTLMQGRGQVEPDEERLEDGIAFAGVAKFPARVKCALLGWSAFKDAAARAVSEQEQQKTEGAA